MNELSSALTNELFHLFLLILTLFVLNSVSLRNRLRWQRNRLRGLGVYRPFRLASGGNMAVCRIHHFVLGVLVTLAAASAANANFVFGSFEDQAPDGFGYFNNGVKPFSAAPAGITYSYTTTGATNGTYALDVTAAGYAQNDLAYDFVGSGDLSQFMANDILSFDFTAPTSATTGGYYQIYSLALNAPGYGFNNVGTQPLVNQYPPYSGQNNVVSFNYDAIKPLIAANPSYLQMIITTNQGGGAPQDFDFDDFQLSQVPEPGSLSIIGLAVAGLLRRRR
jgi:hypothetical protein